MSPARSTRRRSSAPDAVALVLDGVRRLDRGLRLAARHVERETGLSAAQLFVLEHLRDGAALSLNELASRTFTDRSSVSVVVDRLADAGLVTRETDPDDRRRARVRITARGRATLDRAPAAPTDQLLQAVATLPPTTVKTLGASLARLNDALGFTDADMLFGAR
ncbi:MAG TPA: MarR family transcriptional regulator [Gemmatimonadaceae bacterium]|nr:MarR family transcriptional regulator [Gemmatimonadaceae bacterium]